MGTTGTSALFISFIAASSQGLSTTNFPSLYVETSPAGNKPSG